MCKNGRHRSECFDQGTGYTREWIILQRVNELYCSSLGAFQPLLSKPEVAKGSFLRTESVQAVGECVGFSSLSPYFI